MSRISARRLFYEIHLWLGIVSGIVLFIVCLSGTIYTFRDEVERFSQTSKYYVSGTHGSSQMSADVLIAKIEAEQQARVSQIVVPGDANRTWVLRLEFAPAQDGGQQGGPPRMRTLYVDSYAGEVRGEGGNPTDGFFLSMMRLHRFLLLPDNIGRPIVGVATIIFGVLLLTGLILWLPRTLKAWTQWKIWRVGLRIRPAKGWKPFLYDIHNTLGFYMLLPLLIMALTGLCWSFAWYRDAASTVLGDRIFKQRMSRPMQIELPENFSFSSEFISIQGMIDRQNELMPGTGEISVTIPRDMGTATVVDKLRTGFITLAARNKTQWDRSQGRIVSEERFADQTFGSKIAALVRSLHLGDFYGASSKILYFIACLIATTLPLTGVIIWINKLRGRF